MENFYQILKKKINGVILNLIINGLILLVLGVLIVWTDFVLKLLIGLIVLIIAYSFFYLAYKVWTIRKLLK